MSIMSQALRNNWENIARLPDGTWFDFNSDRVTLEIQAKTQAEVRKIRQSFPASKWNKSYIKSLHWWEYGTKVLGMRINIYACTEAPAMCTPIIEQRESVKKIPVEFRNETVVEDVIVGWNCGKEGENAL